MQMKSQLGYSVNQTKPQHRTPMLLRPSTYVAVKRRPNCILR